MTIDDLLNQIHAARCDVIGVEKIVLRAGNTGGSGNQSILSLLAGDHTVEFKNSGGTWVNKA